ncbi:hypothetical protein Cgig2_006705 [Carnegiea gigantea]|uniref:Reverse transcriptase zinc-binding domain-containing protein n=1 Tax=Carnegiea gigantea TaxID=171969 RepID=A0A9Q1Q5M5_9CARY|nr:hypothetical protein Cgig2_006705 [Carnegiea gigantea]
MAKVKRGPSRKHRTPLNGAITQQTPEAQQSPTNPTEMSTVSTGVQTPPVSIGMNLNVEPSRTRAHAQRPLLPVDPIPTGTPNNSASFWANFDISKLRNYGHKLNFVPPQTEGAVTYTKIEPEDIEPEVKYWFVRALAMKRPTAGRGVIGNGDPKPTHLRHQILHRAMQQRALGMRIKIPQPHSVTLIGTPANPGTPTNDLMIFCKAHTPTVSILMDAFKHFSRVTGLQANANKSHIFLAGAQEQTCTEIVNITVCLRVKWVHGLYIQQQNIWNVPIKENTSWYWRKILKVRERMASGYNQNIWQSSTFGDYSIAVSYKWLMGPMDTAPISKVVWCKFNVPRHALCLWRLSLRRLPTKDRLARRGMSLENTQCELCYHNEETHRHIFFECSYTQCVLQNVFCFLRLYTSLYKLEDILLTPTYCQLKQVSISYKSR